MLNELERFIDRPTGRNYLRVRSRILETGSGRPEPKDLAELEASFAEGDFGLVRERMERMLPAWSLSPRFYWLGAVAAREQGDQDSAEIDRFLYQVCLEGLMATGSGSFQLPYLMTYGSDEDELLHYLRLDRERSALVRSPQGLCDVVICQGGRELCFLLEGLPEPDRHESRIRAGWATAKAGGRRH
jgi:hypothetical protein